MPRGESPARDARAGAALARAHGKLDGRLKDGLGKLNVRIAPPERGSAFAALARRASADAADMLRLAAAGACDLACTRAAAVAAWGAGAERAVRAWALARASESDWEAVLDAVGHAHPQRVTARAQLETLARWAAQGPDLAGALAGTTPWVIEVGLDTATRAWLGPEPARWEAEIVQTIAREVGRDEIDEDDARAALADWRWPERAPPLNVVAAGAGLLPPITGDSAWANACAARPRHTWDREGTEIAAVRAGEHQAIERPLKRIRAAARHSVWVSPAENERALERARQAWARSPALGGDGALATPRLAAGRSAHYAAMRWTVDVEGPEALVAAAVWQGVGLERAIEDYLERHATMSLGATPNNRDVRIDQTEARDQRERGARAEALAGIARMLA